MYRKLASGAGANLLAQASGILVQLCAIPLYLHAWSPERYGLWLMLTAIAVQAALLDCGMCAAAMNEIAMRAARGALTAADRLLVAARTALTALALVVLVVAALAVQVVDWQPLATSDGKCALLLLLAASLLHLYSGLFDGVFRAIDRYALGVCVMQAAVLAEFAGAAAGLLGWGSFTATAAGVLAGRGLHFIAVHAYLRRAAPGFSWRLRMGGLDELPPLARPGLAWMGFRMSDALTLQGATLVVGALFGGAAVTAFATARTLCRLLYQAVGALGNALWPEFSRLTAIGDLTTARRLARMAAGASLAGAMAGGLALWLMGPALLRWWTHQAVPPDPLALALLLVHTIVAIGWYIPKMFFAATNRIGTLSIANLATAATTLAAAAVLGQWCGLAGLIAGLIAGELTIALIAAHLLRRHLHGAG